MKKKKSQAERKVTQAHKKKKYKEAIAMIEDYTCIKVAPSGVDGVGVFAIKDIPKGKKLYLNAIPNSFDLPYSEFKKLSKQVQEIILGRWPNIINGSHFLWPDSHIAGFLNHSDTPNYDGKEDKTLRKIKAGEEIFEDYRLIENWEKVYPFIK